jgi:hypothetical protein
MTETTLPPIELLEAEAMFHGTDSLWVKIDSVIKAIGEEGKTNHIGESNEMVSPSEIPVIEYGSEIHTIIEKALYAVWENEVPRGARRAHSSEAWAVLQSIRHYLRTTEPVSVDLEKCAQATRLVLSANCPSQRKSIAKAVLDSAGVKYE